ncbi:hypothetical protein [Paenibacillus sp. MMO-177]|uniref:hypothetical protein n=1 Tax=Paenibacillus sp. MMO-177 TaxID=3081289 RepID=UPI0030160B89
MFKIVKMVEVTEVVEQITEGITRSSREAISVTGIESPFGFIVMDVEVESTSELKVYLLDEWVPYNVFLEEVLSN